VARCRPADTVIETDRHSDATNGCSCHKSDSHQTRLVAGKATLHCQRNGISVMANRDVVETYKQLKGGLLRRRYRRGNRHGGRHSNSHCFLRVAIGTFEPIHSGLSASCPLARVSGYARVNTWQWGDAFCNGSAAANRYADYFQPPASRWRSWNRHYDRTRVT
jgi:hypothetical protein